MDIYLGCFPFLVLMNKVAVDIYVEIIYGLVLSLLSGKYLKYLGAEWLVTMTVHGACP